MIENKCEHRWEKLTNIRASGQPATYLCKKCGAEMSAADVFQLEILLDQVGFKKYTAIFAIIISLVALLVSIFK